MGDLDGTCWKVELEVAGGVAGFARVMLYVLRSRVYDRVWVFEL